MEELSVSIPRLDREQSIVVLQASNVVLSLVAFSVMASAETSHHTEFHYSYYASLTLFVIVGVAGFVYSVFVVLSRHMSLVVEEARRALEVYGSGAMVWLTYTAAVAASATSSDLHTTFDEKVGSQCRVRHSVRTAMAGGYFCSRVVWATVFMYLVCASYAGTLLALVVPGRQRYGEAGGVYDEIGVVEE
ncbi:hypothetical protein CTAYLR_006757 [Chrysophaeum taylorii]|uniref:Casparian strip membrane protein domain-containing protein n=1 Tax=Chrysophaeum taylorii TaxID=2483200 RepID=A0AAD7UBA8_9STRA|nr:hypothetical protein CTAYLR_006757 [Chrysophaeum taylorii]